MKPHPPVTSIFDIVMNGASNIPSYLYHRILKFAFEMSVTVDPPSQVMRMRAVDVRHAVGTATVCVPSDGVEARTTIG